MRTTFSGLELGKIALQAQKTALEVTAHNIANANTVGYTRQRAVFSAATPYTIPSFSKPVGPGQIGTGVLVEQIKRMRDSYLDNQIRNENSTTGFWAAKKDALSKLEVIINEPSDSGLRTVMDQFWESMQLLSQKPEDGSVRAVVMQRALTLTETFNHMDRQLVDLQQDLDYSIEIKVGEVNNLIDQINSLNRQIVTIEQTGDNANDLRDKRDSLVEQISNMIPLESVTEDATGAITITVEGVDVVDGTTFTVEPLTVVPGPPADVQLPAGTSVNFSGKGVVGGMIEARDNIVQGYRDKLDDLADTLITTFNGIHSSGFDINGNTGIDFFSGSTAADIGLAIADPLQIAAASVAGAAGDGSNALLLAQVKHDSTLNIGGAYQGTMDGFYRAMTAQLGIDSQAAIRMVDNQDLLLRQLDNKRQEVSGVSLDEEMTNMIQFQHAYNAAARVVTAIDQMIDVIVNRMGLAGR